MWFRVTIAKDGAIRSCEQVSASFHGGDRILCVEADSDAKAIEKARGIWKKQYRLRVYGEKVSLGICVSCNQPAMQGELVCQTHKERARASYERTMEKRRALGLKHGEKMPKELHAQRNTNAPNLKPKAERNYGGKPAGLLNFRTLLIVQSNFETMSATKFAAWLQERIEEHRAVQHRGAA